MTACIQMEKLRSLLTGRRYGHMIYYTETSTSTQDIAAKFIREGADEGWLVLAETQTAGRGRLARTWYSPPGSGIYMSLILKPHLPQRHMPQLTIVAAATLCRVLRRLTSLDILLKWPNDLLVNGRKISGILVESFSHEGETWMILGVGITVNVRQDEFPDWLQQRATSLAAASGRTWEREEIIASFLHELELLIDLYLQEGFSVFRTIWDLYAWQPDEPIELTTPQGAIRGEPIAIDENGALVIKLEGGSETYIYSGEIIASTS